MATAGQAGAMSVSSHLGKGDAGSQWHSVCWSHQDKRAVDLLELIHRRATEMIRDGAAPYEGRLEIWGCASWIGEGCGRPESGLLNLKRGCKRDGDRLFSRVCCDRQGEMASK